MGDEALPVDGLKVIFGSGSTVDAKGLVTLPRALILHLENCPIFDRAAYPWPFPHPIDQAPIGDDGAVSLNIQQQIWCIRNSLGNAEIFLTEFQATLMSILELCLLDPRRISLDGKREVRLKRRLEEICQGFNQQMMIRSLSSAQLRERLGLLCHSAFAKAEAVILNLDMAQKSHKKILSHTKRGEVRSSYDAFLASFPDVKNVRDGISHEDERVEG